MTIQEALDLTDSMKANDMSRKEKIYFLQEIEQLIHAEILMTHVHMWQQEQIPQITENTDPGTVLLAPQKYAMVYVYYLMSKIAMQNQEDVRENNDRSKFEQAYMMLADWWNRTFWPIPRTRELRI